MAGPWIYPDWPAPVRVRAISTTRQSGVSTGAWSGLNLAEHVGDNLIDVAENRSRLREMLPAEPRWLNQVHGVTVAYADALREVVAADAAVARHRHTVCAVMTADCLPVLFCDDNASVVAVAHAGWRGLHAGVLEDTLACMDVDPASVMAWLGPGIGGDDYEVGDEVKSAFVADMPQAIAAFRMAENEGKWLADLSMLARLRLKQQGVHRVYGGEFNTFSDPERFYSYRRDGVTGRMATLIWLD